MKKFRNNTFRVVAVLLMLSTAPLGVSYSYAESEDNLEFQEVHYDVDFAEKVPLDEIRTVLTEKVVNGKLEVLEFVLPKDTTNEDLKRILSLDGTTKWGYFHPPSYNSGIVLFDGNASRNGEKYWKVSVNGTLNIFKGELDLKLSSKSNHLTTENGKNLTDETLDYRVIFSGNLEDSSQENELAIAVLNSSLKNPETNIGIKALQLEKYTPESGYSVGCTLKDRISI